MADGNSARPMPAYIAGANGRRLKMWRAPNLGPNSAMQGSIETIRARNRQASRNDAWAGAASDKLVSNMVATGIQAVSVNGSKARKAAEKKVWLQFVKKADADGVLDFYGMQALGVREWDEAGEVFARKRSRRESDGLPVPLQIQMIEAEQCPSSYFSTTATGNPIRAGIEFNLIGQRVAYYFYRAHPNDAQFASGFDASTLTRVPAEEVLHLFEPLRVGQIRGIPRATSVLTRLFNLNNLTDAAIERIKIGNLFGAFFEKDSSAADTPKSVIPDTAENDAANQAGEVPNMDLQPATGMELPKGWKVTFSDPPAAGADFFAILRSELLAVAARHGVPYEVLTGDLTGVSDRALRLILNEFRRVIEQRLWLYMVPQFLQPIREWFFDAAVLSGRLDAPGYATEREDYVETLWVPEGWPYSHPVQDVDADRKAIRAGLTSRQATILRNGNDPEQIADEIEADNTEADARGFAFDSDPRTTSNAGLTQARPPGTVIPDPRVGGDPGNATGDNSPNPDPQPTPPQDNNPPQDDNQGTNKP